MSLKAYKFVTGVRFLLGGINYLKFSALVIRQSAELSFIANPEMSLKLNRKKGKSFLTPGSHISI